LDRELIRAAKYVALDDRTTLTKVTELALQAYIVRRLRGTEQEIWNPDTWKRLLEEARAKRVARYAAKRAKKAAE
jgi:hypothetical protein